MHFATLFVALLLQVVANKLEDHSFKPPFDEVDTYGSLVVKKGWKSHGTTDVKQNFVRLTPDRQSKKGALWSGQQLGVPSMSSILKFRISGQGKNFFGDGIAMWLVDQKFHNAGDLHGFHERFTGVAIILDTFRNTENVENHRDVTVLVNDGTKTIEMMTSPVQGCNNMNFRYHNDRADFSVTDSSRMKLVIEGTQLQLWMDPKNSGGWTDCVTVEDIPLSEDWLVHSFIGLTGSTGALADNHDIISLSTYSDHDVMEFHEQLAEEENEFHIDEEGLHTTVDRLKRLEEAMNKMMEDFKISNHHVEHEFAAVEDHMKVMVGKVQKKEDSAEQRIEVLEKLVEEEVESRLEERLAHLEKNLHSKIDFNSENIHNNMESQVQQKVEEAHANILPLIEERDLSDVPIKLIHQDDTSGDWKLPFLILVLLFLVSGIGMFLFYRKLKRTHLL